MVADTPICISYVRFSTPEQLKGDSLKRQLKLSQEYADKHGLLSEGGEDTIDNAGALCPNCHKQAHFGRNREFIKLNKVIPAGEI